jgi:hypothetical protein
VLASYLKLVLLFAPLPAMPTFIATLG